MKNYELFRVLDIKYVEKNCLKESDEIKKSYECFKIEIIIAFKEDIKKSQTRDFSFI